MASSLLQCSRHNAPDGAVRWKAGGDLVRELRGCVLQASLDAHGCRVVQRALGLGDDAARKKIAYELRGHVCQAIESPHANYVIQRVIELMRPSSINFVLGEIEQRPELVRHRFGCRVVQRLIEHFPPERLATYLDKVLLDTWRHCRHCFANYVMQHLLEHGSQAHRSHIIQTLCSDLKSVVRNVYACNVLGKALSYGEDQYRLAKLVLHQGGLGEMARMRTGFEATKRLVWIVHEDAHLLAMAEGQIADRAAGQRSTATPSCLQSYPTARLQTDTTMGSDDSCNLLRRPGACVKDIDPSVHKNMNAQLP